MTRRSIQSIIVALLVAGSLVPVAARADFESCPAGVCSSILSKLTAIEKAIKNFDAANNRGQDAQAEQWRRQADYESKTLSAMLKQQAKVDAMRDYPIPDDAACATITLNQSDHQRAVKGPVAMTKLETTLADLYTDPNSGNQIYQKRIFNGVCKLGAVGNTENDRHGKSCTTPADPNLKDRDVSLARAILDDFCIPLDPNRVAQEFLSLTTSDSYSPSDPNLKEATLAMVLIHRYFRIDQERYPKDAGFDNSMGLYKGSLMSDSLARRYASNDAIMKALDYHACYSKSFMPDCQKGEQEAMAYINDKGLSSDIGLPPGGYCLSQLQIDLVKNIKDAEIQKNYKQGSEALQDIAFSSLENNIQARLAKWKAIDAAAAHAVGSKNEDMVSPQAARAVKD